MHYTNYKIEVEPEPLNLKGRQSLLVPRRVDDLTALLTYRRQPMRWRLFLIDQSASAETSKSRWLAAAQLGIIRQYILDALEPVYSGAAG